MTRFTLVPCSIVLTTLFACSTSDGDGGSGAGGSGSPAGYGGYGLGGMGGASPPCLTCWELVYDGWGLDLESQDVCDEAKAAASSLRGCACTDLGSSFTSLACGSICDDGPASYCAGGNLSSACEACLESTCAAQLTECEMN